VSSYRWQICFPPRQTRPLQPLFLVEMLDEGRAIVPQRHNHVTETVTDVILTGIADSAT
jgi:hypothetical protein